MLSKYFYPHIGGVETHVEKVSRELIKQGHKVTVVTTKHDEKLADVETYQGIKIIRIPVSEKKAKIWASILKYKSLFADSDVVHCHDVFWWYMPLRALLPAKPVYSTFHGWEGDYPIPKKNLNARKIWEKLSTGNICIGEYLSKYYGTKPNLVSYGGCDLPTSPLPVSAKNIKEIVVIGRLEKDLGMKEYLSALKQLKSQFGLKITFVGDGSFRKEAGKLGAVTGWVKDINPYLRRPALVMASGYLTILSAMVSQRPVFALYHNQLKKDYLTLFPGARFMRVSGSTAELVSQVKNALKNTKSIDRMVAQAASFAKQQTWEKVAKQYLKLWQK